ncbi:MAG TPA: BadF/BadG/BcrA/BcrD ATPase family protein [Solirubrobacteraceae bacterium]|jgi:N-acetylglucosamine kinase-like BadF-type ATPase|nr:BadF/BadG/BcrA/BcrD ATPase family protein [Solirubrobacteraceae bacterium]
MTQESAAVAQPSLVELPAMLSTAQRRTDARYVMGVDGGATKTLAAVLDLHAPGGAAAPKLYLGHGGPSNEDAVGPEAAVRELLKAADEALAHAGIDAAQLGAAVLAIAGTDTEDVARNVRSARTDAWLVVNDVVAAWATATGGGPGLAAIAGTGSNVFGVGGTGAATRAWRAGGWGHLLGDEGSGYWLGVQSIKAALRHREASGPATALSEALPSFFGEPSVEAVANSVYSKPLTKGEIAAFAIETARLAEQGDAVARELYERGARELGEQIAAVIRQTGLAEGAGDAEAAEFPVGLIGSAFKAGAVFVEPLTRVIHACAPGARVATVEMAPVGGSLMLAARACGHRDAVGDAGALASLIERALRG